MNDTSKEADDLALVLYNVAWKREHRGENNPTHVIAVALQKLMDERDLYKGQIAVTEGDHEPR